MAELDVNAEFDRIIAAVHDRLSRNLRIRRTLPGDGRLRLDRQLPFLCVYRSPPSGRDAGTRDLVTTEAAYLFASGDAEYAAGLDRLCKSISETITEHFGALLVIEIWSASSAGSSAPASEPSFKIHASTCEALAKTVKALSSALHEVRLHGMAARVELLDTPAPHPPGLPPIVAGCREGSMVVGIEVGPVFRDAASGALFPIVMQSLRRQLAVAIRKAVFAFTGRQEIHRVVHYESLGPSALARAGRQVDQQLCEIAQSFEFLLYSTPVNSEAAWKEFAESGHRRLPTLYYRPLPYHPAMIKRELYAVPIEHVEDSSLAQLFQQKQDEIDHQLDALKHLGTRDYLYDSLQLHGQPDDELVQLADDILVRTQECDDDHGPMIGAAQVAAAARDQIDYYHQRLPDFQAKVQLTDAIASALMVAHDQLLIAQSISIRETRLEPLLHHEVGTHLLTYFNGRQQPLRLLSTGFPGYEALQEGLAVLAEYLVGGLTLGRTRTLAARVAAVHSMLAGASFLETFDLLHRQRGIGGKIAFMTTLRVYRGGGLTKDALYLGGLRDLLGYLHDGHDLEPLYVGKLALEHAPLVRELRSRGLVSPPALLPRSWEDASHEPLLQKCRKLTLLDLLETSL